MRPWLSPCPVYSTIRLSNLASNVYLYFTLSSSCLVFLLLPQFFSKRGRQALIAYVFILAFSGPVKNTLHNIGVLSESLACAQVRLYHSLSLNPSFAIIERIVPNGFPYILYIYTYTFEGTCSAMRYRRNNFIF